MKYQRPHLIANGHIGNPLERVFDNKEQCKYSNKCPIRYLRKTNCTSEDKINHCQTYNYYRRLEKVSQENEDNLFIGSRK